MESAEHNITNKNIEVQSFSKIFKNKPFYTITFTKINFAESRLNYMKNIG